MLMIRKTENAYLKNKQTNKQYSHWSTILPLPQPDSHYSALSPTYPLVTLAQGSSVL